MKVPWQVMADKGYDAAALRTTIFEQNAWANIPPRSNRKDPVCFSPYLYRERNLVERFFNKIKHFRRVATRYDKLAENYLAALKLAAIRTGYAVMSLRPKQIGLLGEDGKDVAPTTKEAKPKAAPKPSADD